MEDLKCPVCGVGVEAGAFFCAGCGASMDTEAAEPGTNAGESQPEAQAMFSQAAPVMEDAVASAPPAGAPAASGVGQETPPQVVLTHGAAPQATPVQDAAPQPTAAPAMAPLGGMESGAAMGVGAPPPAPGYGYPPNTYGAQPGPYGAAPVPQPMPQPVVRDETVSIWSYIWPDLLVYIPFLGWIAWLIVMIVLAASGDKPSYRNFAKARLLMLAIGVGLAILTVLLFGTVLSTALYNYF